MSGIAVYTDLPEDAPTYRSVKLLLGDSFERVTENSSGSQLNSCDRALLIGKPPFLMS